MSDFQQNIIKWYTSNFRDFPWRETKNPYFIWLSEIILQQTRALQGLPYYQKFTQQFPSVIDLANAHQDEILKTWQGLGYYSRARNLHATAKQITADFAGEFPNSFDELIKLKGIGPYTAAAISSFAFNEKRAVLDGNVFRVLSRFYMDDTPIDTSAGRKTFQLYADELISEKQPDLFNQAIMELGATVCTPKTPNCQECPVHEMCLASLKSVPLNYPVKSKKTKVQNRYMVYFIFKKEGKYIIQQRTKKDIWQGLFEFPVLDAFSPISAIEIEKYLTQRNVFQKVEISEPIKHILSHQKLAVQFIHIDQTPVLYENEIMISHFESHALPRVIDKYLASKHL